MRLFLVRFGLVAALAWPTLGWSQSPPTYVTHWGRTGTAPGLMRFPGGVTTDDQGNVYVSELTGDRIQKFDSLGTLLGGWGGFGAEDGEFNGPSDIVVDRRQRLWVTDRENHRLQWFTLDGQFLGALGDSSRQEFNTPNGMGLDPNGPYLFIADSFHHRIRKFDISGDEPVHVVSFGEFGGEVGQFATPMDVAISAIGEIHTVEFSANRLQIFGPTGDFRLAMGTNGRGPGEFTAPSGITLDEHGQIYIVDTLNGRIQMFRRNGTYILEWGPSRIKAETLAQPIRMTLTPTGLIYICDTPRGALNLDRVLVFRREVVTSVSRRSLSETRALYRGR